MTAAFRQCQGQTYRVMVVDDHPRVRDMLAMLVVLDDKRLDVQSLCEVGTGEEAVTEARTYRPHVVLMDIHLPGMNGFEAARKIKEDYPSVHIVMVTAFAEPEYREKAARLGAAGLVSKDRVAIELIPLISQVLVGSRGAE